MPGTRLPTWKATCSVSAKKFVVLAVNVSRPIGCTGAISSGTIFVGSSRSIPSNVCSGVSGNDLDAELPLRQVPGLDGVGEITTMEVGFAAGGELSLLPDEGMHSRAWLPVELHQGGRPVFGHESEGVHTETLHHPVGRLNAAVGHVPHRVVLSLRVERDEVPEGVVCGLCLRDLAIGVGLAGVDDVGELDAVLDEEDRNVVADKVERALVGVELHCEAAGVPNGVGRTTRPQHRREPGEDRCLDAVSQKAGAGDRGCGAVATEDAMGSCSARVHHTLGDALVVEVRDLLSQVVVLQQRRPTLSGLE